MCTSFLLRGPAFCIVLFIHPPVCTQLSISPVNNDWPVLGKALVGKDFDYCIRAAVAIFSVICSRVHSILHPSISHADDLDVLCVVNVR